MIKINYKMYDEALFCAIYFITSISMDQETTNQGNYMKTD